MLDADHITHGLWQGSAPSPKDINPRDFSVVVLCAKEYQPPARLFDPGVVVVHAPNDDTCTRYPTDEEFRLADDASDLVADALCDRKKVLVTCAMGLNRSGLVSALALVKGGFSPQEAVELIRKKRPGALGNPYFARLILALRIIRSE